MKQKATPREATRRSGGFTPILIILVLIALVILGYFGYKNYWPKTQVSPTSTASQTPNGDLANWKTYTNTKHKYSFKYPPELTVGNGKDPESAFKDVDNVFIFDRDLSSSFDVFYEDNTNKLTIDDWLKSDRGKFFNGNNSTYQIENINGISWYNFTPALTFSLDPSAFRWVVFHNEDIFLVGSHTKLTDDTVGTILSTFKFLDQSNTEGKFCGGFAGVACPKGYSCKLDGKYPDAGGVCIKN